MRNMHVGAMWGIAQAGFFIANGALSPAVTFPIATSMPGVVAALLSVFVFGEIKVLCSIIASNYLVFRFVMCGRIRISAMIASRNLLQVAILAIRFIARLLRSYLRYLLSSTFHDYILSATA